jgi:hypothetical protein
VAALKASHERLEALKDVSVKAMETFIKSKEPTSLESVVVHEEGPKKRLQCDLSEH